MPAYLSRLVDHSCKTCGRAATYELRNTHNAPVGWYCGKHAKPALEAFQREHER